MKDNIIIRTENLCKYYKGDIHALHNVTAEIEKGEVVVIEESFGIRVTEIIK